MKIFGTLIFTVFCLILSSFAVNAQTANAEQKRYKLAADYSRQFRGLSVLVIKGDRIVFEEYQNGFAADGAHQLASGTKSFAGVTAVAAVEDKFFRLDDRVSDTITEWKTDARKSKITIRQLLTLTGGLETGAMGRPPAYADAVAFSAKYEPGDVFEYGPAPFQAFGELMRRKLESRKETPLDYLKRRILNPIGLNVASWTMQNGQPNIPSGAFLTAREWAKFGLLLKNGGRWNGKQIVAKKLLDECFVGTKANPNYGLTFWLNRAHDGKASIAEKANGRRQVLRDALDIEPETARIAQNGIGAEFPEDLLMAAGAGKQRLYIIPSLDLVVVRQGRQSRFDDAEFLKRLLPAVKSESSKDLKVFANHSFSFSAPGDLVDQKVHGIDSFVGEYESEEMTIGFDYGRYSNPLDDCRKFSWTTIGGSRAKVCSYIKREEDTSDGKKYFTGVYFPQISRRDPTKLTLTVNCNPVGCRTQAEKIVRSIRFK